MKADKSSPAFGFAFPWQSVQYLDRTGSTWPSNVAAFASGDADPPGSSAASTEVIPSATRPQIAINRGSVIKSPRREPFDTGGPPFYAIGPTLNRG